MPSLDIQTSLFLLVLIPRYCGDFLNPYKGLKGPLWRHSSARSSTFCILTMLYLTTSLYMCTHTYHSIQHIQIHIFTLVHDDVVYEKIYDVHICSAQRTFTGDRNIKSQKTNLHNIHNLEPLNYKTSTCNSQNINKINSSMSTWLTYPMSQMRIVSGVDNLCRLAFSLSNTSVKGNTIFLSEYSMTDSLFRSGWNHRIATNTWDRDNNFWMSVGTFGWIVFSSMLYNL